MKLGGSSSRGRCLRTALLSEAFRVSVLVGFQSYIPVGARLTVPDSVLDGVPECPLDAGFPQTTEEPLLGDYEYKSDSDPYDKAQSVSPTSPLPSENPQIPGGHGLS